MRSRLEVFADKVTEMMLIAMNHAPQGQQESAAKALLKRELKSLARAIDCDTQGPAQSFLEEDDPDASQG